MVAERVFIGHDPADEAMLRALVKHLQPLVAAGRIETWDTTRIPPGSDRRREIQRELGRARLAVALVSADFLASEMADLLGNRRDDGLPVVPILARPCIVEGTWIAGLQMLPATGRSIMEGRTSEQERSFADIALAVAKRVEEVVAEAERAAAGAAEASRPRKKGRGKQGSPAVRTKTPDVEKAPVPRVLVAGPWFGIAPGVRDEIRRLWREGPASRALVRIGGLLQQNDILAAHLAAIARYSVVVDASPWRAFARRRSLGFRDGETASAENPAAWQADGTPIGFFAFGAGDLPPMEDKAPAGLVSRVSTLSERAPWLAAMLRASAEEGVAWSGFESGDAAWYQVLSPLFGARPALLDFPTEGVAITSARISRAPTPLDAPLSSPTLDDYARALRVVAGQVRLSGDEEERAIEQVFVALEVSTGARRAESDGDGTPRDRRFGAARTGPESAGTDAGKRAGAGHRADSAPVADRPDAGEAQDEIDARRRRDTPNERRVSAESIATIAPRVMLWGTAGTGKSTFLQWLACRTLGSDRVPVWVPRIVRDHADPCEQFARLALRAVGLSEGPSAARDALQAAMREGRALLLLDGLDEASPSVQVALHERVGRLSCRAIVASRPTVREVRAVAHGFTEVTLVGLVPGGSERFLRAYFGVAEWIGPLLRELHRLPEGATWARTPVLLALAASLYRRARRLPEATLDLYREVVHGLFRVACERAEVEATDERIRDAEGSLAKLARRMLVPEEGDVEVAVPRAEVPPLLLASGLFTGQIWLRFAHLTVGEYLAASSDIDVRVETARLLHGEQIAPEVLPIALARRAPAALEDLLADAEAGDTAEHVKVELLLRAMTYGGQGVVQFAKEQAPRVLRIVIAALRSPSGRFGGHEARLGRRAESAVTLLAPGFGGPQAREIESLASGSGQAGLEGLILGWAARLEEPRRHPAFGRGALRAGEALAPRLASLGALHALLDGERWPDVRAAAVAALASDPDSKSLLKDALRDDYSNVRTAVVAALASDPDSKSLLKDALRDNDFRVRAAAVAALASDPDSKSLLKDALRDNDFRVRAAAVAALASDPDSKSLLKDALRDNDFRVRAAAVAALASDPDSKSLLKDALRDEDNDVRAAAVAALASDPDSKSLLKDALRDEDNDVRAAAVAALASDPDSKSLLKDALRDEDNDVRAAAVAALASDPDSKSLLKDALRDNDFRVRAAAVAALASDPDSKSLLKDALRDNDGYVRAAAVAALASDPDSKSLLKDALRDNDGYVRAAAVAALASDPDSKSLLKDALRDNDFRVRAAAVAALASDPDSKSLLKDALRDNDGYVRAAAVAALASDPDSKSLLKDALRNDYSNVRAAAVAALAGDPDSKSLLKDALRDKEGYVRAAAVAALASDPDSKSLLKDALRDDYSNVRAAAVAALASDPDSKSLLKDALRDNHYSVRAAAVAALASDPDSKSLLKDALRDDYSNVRAAAVAALASDPDSKSLLKDALRDKEGYVRAAAVAALASDPDSKSLLKDALRDNDFRVRAAAVAALASDPDSKSLLKDALRDNDFRVRAAAVAALASDPDSKSLLKDALRDEDNDVRAAAVAALASDPDSKSLLKDALRDNDFRVRAAAVAALRPSTLAAAAPLLALPAARPALRVSGHDPTGDLPLDPASHALETRIGAFVRAPRHFHLDREPAFAEALLGWLCVRLGQVHSPALGSPAVFGEVAASLPSLFDSPSPIVIRIAMDHTDLPRERSVLPVHNVMEAWRVARHLFTDRDIEIWLACADVGFEDLVPPPREKWSCGDWHAGPTFFGFALPKGPGPALDPWMEVWTSIHAAERWSLSGPDERAKIERTLADLAADLSTDSWALVPLLGRMGHLLSPPLRSLLAARLPTSLQEAAERLSAARRALGAEPSSAAPPDSTSAAVLRAAPAAEKPALVLFAEARDAFESHLAAGSLDAATDALQRAIGLAPKLTDPADLVDLVRWLDELRDRARARPLVQRLADLVSLLRALPLDPSARARLGQVSYGLTLFLKR